MKTNEPHPLAVAPIFNCMKRPENVGWIDGAVRVQISGFLVGFLIKEVINSVGGHFEGSLTKSHCFQVADDSFPNVSLFSLQLENRWSCEWGRLLSPTDIISIRMLTTILVHSQACVWH
jgi:hypothetical protein